MNAIWIIFVALFTTAIYADEQRDEFFDTFMTELTTKFKNEGLDPAKLPGKKVTFSKPMKIKRLPSFTVKGSAEIYAGTLSGIATMHREGPASVGIRDGKIFLKADVVFGQLVAFYRAKLKVMSLGPKFKANMTMDGVKASFEVSQAEGGPAELVTFQLTDTGRLKMGQFRGLGPLNKYVNKFAGKLLGFVKGSIVHMFKGTIKRRITSGLSGIEIDRSEFV